METRALKSEDHAKIPGGSADSDRSGKTRGANPEPGRSLEDGDETRTRTPITNQDEQETITNQSAGKTSASDAEISERERNQGNRMGPEYIKDDSEIVTDEAENIKREAQ